MATDNHDLLIKAVQEYCKWQDRFFYKKSEEAGIKARKFLNQIRKLANQRRHEIINLTKERRAARNGQKGRPRKDT